MAAASREGRIREALADGRARDAAQIAEALKLRTWEEMRAVQRALDELARRGVVTREERPPVYRLRALAGRGQAQKKIWAAMVIEARGFTVRQICRLSGAGPDYTKRFVRWLVSRGFVEPAGRDQGAPVYRVTPGQERTTPPHWNRRAEQRKKGGGP